ncbi:MAG: acylneuraminate cytidylyltransferase family protein [Labilithrix sp.]|nr:acylneuraminate cytidylyltransferase family protein [Labilithrix sp.]MCW5814731.1 acylneuraminate cytidylyltransferase family protein [Labilithrix sp.]
MLHQRRVLAIVAGRGGSKGLPGKNVASCGGRPLVEWSVAAARASRHVDRVIVTTDDDAIRAAAVAAGAEAPFVRPPELASDSAKMDAVVLHALDAVGGGFEIGVLLQATSPLRTGADIDGALALMDRLGRSSVVAVTEPGKSPYWMYTLADGDRLVPLFPDLPTGLQRQALPKAYVPNGAVYGFDVAWFREQRMFVGPETAAYVMAPERSVDVDGPLDLLVADALLSRR